MLEFKNVSVEVAGKVVVHDFSGIFIYGSLSAIMGQNGSGKSSLLLALMGHPKYRVTGEILLDGVDISSLSPTERAAKGVFLALQSTPEISGVSLSEYLRTIYNERIKRSNPETKPLTPFVFRRLVTPFFEKLNLPITFLDRDLGVGFSGGEKRRLEMLQCELLSPKVICFDEIDAGLDVDSLQKIQDRIIELRSPDRIIIVITHNPALLEALGPTARILLEKTTVVDAPAFIF